MSQPQPNILQLAKQGNPKAIETIINRQLEPKGIVAQVDLKDNCLQIIIEAIQLPPQQIIVEYFRKSFTNLGAIALRGHLPSCLWAGINDDWFENRRERLITLFYHLEASGIGNILKQ